MKFTSPTAKIPQDLQIEIIVRPDQSSFLVSGSHNHLKDQEIQRSLYEAGWRIDQTRGSGWVASFPDCDETTLQLAAQQVRIAFLTPSNPEPV